MTFAEHLKLIKRIMRESALMVFVGAVGLLLPFLGAVYDYWLTAEEQRDVTASIRKMLLLYWEYGVIIFLVSAVVILYKRLVPKLEIIYEPTNRFVRLENGLRTYVVDLVNHGEWQDNISFRLERIEDLKGGIPFHGRRGFEREGGAGPMPLSPESPKTAFIASLDERDPNSKIQLRLVDFIPPEYVPDPLALEGPEYYLEISLNPRLGRPHKKRFHLYADKSHKLHMDVPTTFGEL